MRPEAALALALLTGGCVDESISGYADRDAVWELTELDGRPFDARAEITFSAAGQVTGQGPCNRFSARQSVPMPWIRIEGIAATRLACPALAAEAAFFAALDDMTLAEVAGNVLILSNDTGREMVFHAAR